MKKNSERFFLLLFGLAAGLVLAEFSASWILPKPLLQRLPIPKMQADPHCGYFYKPSQEGYTLDSKVVINHWGFRGPDWKLQKNPGVIRVALLGDSYIFGQGVGESETAAAQLEVILNSGASAGTRYEVLNFGISGYDSGHEIKVLEHKVLQFQPDIVFLCFFLNDLFYIKDYAFYPALFEKERREFSPLKWQLRNLLRLSRLAMYGWDLLNGMSQKSEVLRVLRAYAVENALPSHGPEQSGWVFTLDRMKDFSLLAEKNHFKSFLAVIPAPEEIQRGASAPYENYLFQEGSKLGIQPVDIFAGLQSEDLKPWKKWLIPYDYHLNVDGNRVAAEVFARAVRSFYSQRPGP